MAAAVAKAKILLMSTGNSVSPTEGFVYMCTRKHRDQLESFMQESIVFFDINYAGIES